MAGLSCPHCKSTNTRSFEAISQSGSFHGEIELSLTDASLRGSDGYGTVSLVSEEARASARPVATVSRTTSLGTFLFYLGAVFMVILGLLWFFTESPSPQKAILQGMLTVTAGLFAIGTTVYAIGRAMDARRNADLEQNIASWRDMWRCSTCGKAFKCQQ
jgi:hypothetical protein